MFLVAEAGPTLALIQGLEPLARFPGFCPHFPVSQPSHHLCPHTSVVSLDISVAAAWCSLCCGSPFPERSLGIYVSCWVPAFKTCVSGLKFILFSLAGGFLVTVSSFLVLSYLCFFLLCSVSCRFVGESLCPSCCDFQPPLSRRSCCWGSSWSLSCSSQPSFLVAGLQVCL